MVDGGNIHPKDAKLTLASEITDIFWGVDESKRARSHFQSVFQAGDLPEDIGDYNVSLNTRLVEVLVGCEFAGSRSSARRLIEQGAVKLDSVKMLDVQAELCDSGNTILQVGKRRVVNLIVGNE